MPEADVFRVRIRIHSDEGLNLAELGSLCTAVNRTLQVAAGSAPADMNREPQQIDARVESVERGSVVITTLLDFFNAQVAQEAFLASMLGNAGFELLGLLAKNVRKALARTSAEGERVRIEPVMDTSTEPLSHAPSNANRVATARAGRRPTTKHFVVEMTVEAPARRRHLEVRAEVALRRPPQRR